MGRYTRHIATRAKRLAALGVVCALEGVMSVGRHTTLGVLLFLLSIILILIGAKDTLMVWAIRRTVLDWIPKGSIYVDEEDEA